jgi:hypothetical protein
MGTFLSSTLGDTFTELRHDPILPLAFLRNLH